jgi:hypothetical protein
VPREPKCLDGCARHIHIRENSHHS